MILIVGDSWACGEWGGQGDHRSCVSHGGLGQYLREQGHVVVNLAKGGGSNLESASRVDDFLAQENGFVEQVSAVIVFQTEWIRDAVNLWNLNEFQQVNYDYQQYKARLISRFYHRLSHAATHCQRPVYVIGGCSDTMWLDLFEQEYPGVQIVCQSWINLIINNNHRVEQPVFARFGSETLSLIEHAKNTLSQDNMKHLLDDLDLAQQRNSQWQQLYHRGLLCEDRTHPNRQAHKILFDHISSSISTI